VLLSLSAPSIPHFTGITADSDSAMSSVSWTIDTAGYMNELPLKCQVYDHPSGKAVFGEEILQVICESARGKLFFEKMMLLEELFLSESPIR